MFLLRSKFVGRRNTLGTRPNQRVVLGKKPTPIGRPKPRTPF